MYDSDDIRYQAPTERPPWELSPTGHLREWFSRHSTDTEEQYEFSSQEMRRARAVQERRHRRQKAQRAQLSAQRAADQANLRRISTSERGDPETVGRPTAWDQTGPQQARGRTASSRAQAPTQPRAGADPRGARYVYQRPSAAAPASAVNRQSNRSRNLFFIVLAICLVVLAVLVVNFASGSDSASIAEAPAQEDEGIDVLPEPDESWDNALDDIFEAEAADETQSLPQAELPGAFSLELQSSAGREALSYQEIYQRCLPSIVSISTDGAEGMGSGTGIVLTEDGYILTCNHVIEETYTCQVTTWDDEVYEATLVGGDAQTDLAVLKIDASGLTPAEFGRSDELTVGDEALAIGDPLGSTLRGTLTNGIISAINRDVTVNGYQMTLIQTTAALNSGNSGGPLINIYGQVVGVTNMKMNSTNVTVEGLGFAVPTSVVQEILPILAERGYVSRPVLGISCITSDGTEGPAGLIVASIDSASDAGARGLLVNDCITHVDGEPVSEVSQVRTILESHAIGDEITLTVQRLDEESGQWEELTVTITLMDQADLAG